MRGSFPKLVRWYLRLKPWEVSGRMYEWMGIRWVDQRLSAMFGEAPLPRYSPGSELPKALLQRTLLRGQYSEIVNFICALIYVGLVVVCLWPGYLGLAVFAALIGLHHLLILPIERYKRALVGEWLEHPEALTDGPADLDPPYLRTRKELVHWYFRPLSFESVELYDRIGIHSYRLFVFWMTNMVESFADEEARVHAPNQIKNPSIEQLDQFERGTRTSETVHLLGILEHLPFAIVFLNKLYWVGLVYMLGIAYLNIYAIFLQRQHRVRLFKLLLRRADKLESKKA